MRVLAEKQEVFDDEADEQREAEDPKGEDWSQREKEQDVGKSVDRCLRCIWRRSSVRGTALPADAGSAVLNAVERRKERKPETPAEIDGRPFEPASLARCERLVVGSRSCQPVQR
jgi:hypothetical protein